MIRASLALAVVAAWLLALRVPTTRQREVATCLTALLALDMARLAGLPRPVDHAAFVGWYAVTAAMVAELLLSPPRWALVAVTLPFVAVATLDRAGSAYWVALGIQVGCAARYLARRPIPGQVETVGLLVAASSLADVVGPWLLSEPGRDWKYGTIPSVVTWLAVAGWEGRCWIGARMSRA
jgi:hypothetical protein